MTTLIVGLLFDSIILPASRTAENGLFFSSQNVIDGFHTHHDRVVHIANLVSPRTESAAGIDSFFHQSRLQYSERPVAPKGGDGIGVGDRTVIAGNNSAPVTFVKHPGANEAGDDLIEHLLRIWSLTHTEGHLAHQ